MMRLNRRLFLSAAGAAIATPILATTKPQIIRAMPSDVRLAPGDRPKTRIWSYGGATPGTALRYRRGDRLVATLNNELPQDTTIHWHGLRLPNAMDGVPGLTQKAVAPGDSFDYAFDLTDAGTY